METETQALETAAGTLNLKEWHHALLGQKPDHSKFNIELALGTLPRTEVRAAEAIKGKFANTVSYVAASGTWYIWDGRIHRPCVDDGIAIKVAKYYYKATVDALDFIKEHYERQAKVIESAQGQDWEKKAKAQRDEYNKGEALKHKKFRERIATADGNSALVRLLKTELDVNHDYFGDDRRWFVVENGVFDMEGVRRDERFDLLPHDSARPVYRMWSITDTPGAPCPALNKFLDESIEDRGQSHFFSKAVALACMGAPISSRTIVSLQGKRKSGKSMINRAIDRLTNKNGIYAEPPRDAIVKGGTNPKHARHDMRIARYIAFTEITDPLDREFVLKYTGGDGMPVEQKYEVGGTVKPQGIIFMASNHGMDIDKTDEAVFERIAPITFPRTFEKVSTDGTHILDPDLEDKIVSEAPGFLEWMKRSYLEYLKSGLDKTETMEAAKRSERDDEVSVTQYIKDRVETKYLRIDPAAKDALSVPMATLYSDYYQWCIAYGVPVNSRMQRKQFNLEVARTYPKVTYQTVRFSGLVLASI
ncbi:hypothetical protein [Arthrobacter sp. CAN_C5]|uniref:hypothetical protein n=1 Tax=Arthrobacter sp. CAN_C5 TaxID=2760706 RepID=UPI001AE46834|nr:hypothetical protein [Arthrobacter sp. CAN_C5]MBP2216789.1 phage/plasmid-associated DNA primase [Arthrobacter sp. CAN_C5]